MDNAKRSLSSALYHGGAGKCPACGRGNLFDGYLKVREKCDSCQTELQNHRADDAPPYFTIFIVGHIIIPLLIAVETVWRQPYWMHLVIWLPATVILSLIVLRITKGMTIGLQWANEMHGFARKE